MRQLLNGSSYRRHLLLRHLLPRLGQLLNDSFYRVIKADVDEVVGGRNLDGLKQLGKVLVFGLG